MKRSVRLSIGIAVLAMIVVTGGTAVIAVAQHSHGGSHGTAARPAKPNNSAEDLREAVLFPDALRHETLANMRDHLLALSEIQEALANDRFDAAAEIAEDRLGMNSLRRHGAHEVARYMPEGMQQIGSGMHRSASRFALAAKDAGVTGDLKSALAKLAETTQACVACHSAYRLQ